MIVEGDMSDGTIVEVYPMDKARVVQLVEVHEVAVPGGRTYHSDMCQGTAFQAESLDTGRDGC